MPSKAAGEGSKVEGIDVDGGGEIWSIRRDEGSEAGIHDEVVEGSKGSVASAGTNRAKEMPKARPDAEADEEVSLIRGIGAGII